MNMSEIEEISEEELYEYTCERMHETSSPRVVEPDYHKPEMIYNELLSKYADVLLNKLSDEFKCKDEYTLITSPCSLDKLKYKDDVDMFAVYNIINNISKLMFDKVCMFIRYPVSDAFLQSLRIKIYQDIRSISEPMIQDYIRIRRL